MGGLRIISKHKSLHGFFYGEISCLPPVQPLPGAHMICNGNRQSIVKRINKNQQTPRCMDTQNIKNSTQTIERFGWVTKEEPLSCLVDDNLHLNIGILESVAPFFGYYADEPGKEKPDYLYWVLDQWYPLEQITRVLHHIRDHCHAGLDAAPGHIVITDDSFHVVRMRNLKRYNQIHAVQKMFEEKGIKLKKRYDRIQNQMGVIHLNKFFYLKPLEGGLYLEPGSPHRGYFKIPAYINWNDFKALTKEVKYETSLMFFDAARVAIVEDGKITELVRIYRENLNPEKLMAIRDRYLKILSRA